MRKPRAESTGIFMACHSSGLITVGFERFRRRNDRYQELTTEAPAVAVSWMVSRGMPVAHARQLVHDLQQTEAGHQLIFNPSSEAARSTRPARRTGPLGLAGHEA